MRRPAGGGDEVYSTNLSLLIDGARSVVVSLSTASASCSCNHFHHFIIASVLPHAAAVILSRSFRMARDNGLKRLEGDLSLSQAGARSSVLSSGLQTQAGVVAFVVVLFPGRCQWS